MLELQNISDAKVKLLNYDPTIFSGVGNSFKFYLNKLKINNFRHISDLEITFDHPITVITGINKIGKTSLLLLIACSHHNFQKYDSTKPNTVLRRHTWRDVLTFTSYETATGNYSYELFWRVGIDNRNGEGKRLATSKSWTGLGKYSSANRMNAKIKDKEVRFIDLERLLPARNFSNSLLRKISGTGGIRLSSDIEQAFAYILDIPGGVEIKKIGAHINKIAYLISYSAEPYSSYNAATGEESLISILIDIIDTPENSLILIDEIEAGLHPSIQRKLSDIIQYISWRHKKQFILTTHSPSVLAAFPKKSRRFIDKKLDGRYETINEISVNGAFSKMDSKAFPLIHLYCEDVEAEFIIRNLLIKLNIEYKHFDRLVNIIKSGPANLVKADYETHKRNFSQMRFKIGYSCVFDGDYVSTSGYSQYHNNASEYSFFLYPHIAPEKFLVQFYLNANPNTQLATALTNIDHHSLFQEMTNLGIAADKNHARQICWDVFVSTAEYSTLFEDFKIFITNAVDHFSKLDD
ncbi:AAA family ATPase [Chryseobacterium gleum]|uniref:AAA family ATPase n=1 Tax=Chryseobacterium gleum TaxID=250 RepID=UPI00241D7822|nr:AAA family ATPase [Chryseobacterium gleum]